MARVDILVPAVLRQLCNDTGFSELLFIGLGKFSSDSGLSRFLFVCFCVVLTLKGFTDLYCHPSLIFFEE